MGRRLPRFSGMTMVPARSFLQYPGYGSTGYDHWDTNEEDFYSYRTPFDPTDHRIRLRSDLASEYSMADEHDQSMGVRFNGAAAASSSMEAVQEEKEEEVVPQGEDHGVDKDEVDERWLRLGLGGPARGDEEEEERTTATTTATMMATVSGAGADHRLVDFFSTHHQQSAPATPQYGGDSGSAAVASLLFHQPMTSLSLRQLSPDTALPISSFGMWNFSATATPQPLLPFYSQPLLPGARIGFFEAGSSSAATGPNFGSQRTSPAGIWFALRAAQKL